MLVDEAKIKVTAGKGGDGMVAFDKVKMSLGPTGGRGGNGGNVIFSGVSDIFALRKYRNKKEYWAQDGKAGRGNRSDGPNGEDLILEVPVGTVIHNLDAKRDIEIVEVGQKVLAAKGGIGGRGNFSFRSPSNTSPKEAEEGKPGENFHYELELRLIAEAGFIGLPSAGKSSLLNELTSANVKTGEYHFTTLEPNLGAFEGIILADIPGLIEGASSGKGLGIKFLRHIRRTLILLHCVSAESEDPAKDYEIVRRELEKYDPELTKKKELIILTKTDLISPLEIEKKKKKLQKLNPEVVAVSIHNWEFLESLREKLIKILR